MAAHRKTRAPAVVIVGRLFRRGMVSLQLVVGGFVHGGTTGRQKRGGKQEDEAENSCGHAWEKSRAGRGAAPHILMNRLMPRMNAAIDAATSRPKLPRMTYSQIVEMMLKKEGMLASHL